MESIKLMKILEQYLSRFHKFKEIIFDNIGNRYIRRQYLYVFLQIMGPGIVFTAIFFVMSLFRTGRDAQALRYASLGLFVIFLIFSLLRTFVITVVAYVQSEKQLKIQAELFNLIRPRWHGNPPLDSFAALNEIESKIVAKLPTNYKSFLRFFSNGGEGDFPRGHVLLFKAEEILRKTSEYTIYAWAPHLLPIGLDGDDIFCFELSRRKKPSTYKVVRVSLSAREKKGSEIVGNNFFDFLDRWVKNRLDS